jgi:hypothetical protein
MAIFPVPVEGFGVTEARGVFILTPFTGESFRLRMPGSGSSSLAFGLLPSSTARAFELLLLTQPKESQ